jgi:hypothetical protein
MRITSTLLMCIFIFSCSHSQTNKCVSGEIVFPSETLLRITGTFTNIQVTDAGIFGAEVHIARTESPTYQAVVQFGSGNFCKSGDRGKEPCFQTSNLLIVDVLFDHGLDSAGQQHLSFHVSSDNMYSGHFEGQLSESELSGVFKRVNGEQIELRMPRSVSHWDN